jgi:DNA-binding response OmpR family regulator
MVICTAYADYSQEDLARRLGQSDKLLLLKKPFDSIEVTQLARTLTEKWYLARQAALKMEQMELLVSQRTRKLVELQPPAVPAPEPETELESEAEERQPVILLAAESEELGAEISRALETDRQIVLARDGAAALEKARELVPDLILIDTHAPSLGGLSLCRQLKAELVTSHIPVVVMGPGESTDRRLEALNAGADDYFDKPLRGAGIEARVVKWLQLRRHPAHRQPGSEAWRARELSLGTADARFLQRVVAIAEQNLSDFEFDVEALARCSAVSRRQLFRKLKALVDTTPKALIRSIRLRRAAQLLAESKMTVTEITFAVGFLDVKHFRAVFKQEFGVVPSEFLHKGTPETASGGDGWRRAD